MTPALQALLTQAVDVIVGAAITAVGVAAAAALLAFCKRAKAEAANISNATLRDIADEVIAAVEQWASAAGGKTGAEKQTEALTRVATRGVTLDDTHIQAAVAKMKATGLRDVLASAKGVEGAVSDGVLRTTGPVLSAHPVAITPPTSSTSANQQGGA